MFKRKRRSTLYIIFIFLLFCPLIFSFTSVAEKVVLELEEDIVAQKQRRILDRNLAVSLGIILFVGLGLKVLQEIFKKRQDYSITTEETPPYYPPGIVGVLWRKSRPGRREFWATIIDLAQRGFLSIEAETKKKKVIFWERKNLHSAKLVSGENSEIPRPYEEYLLDFLFSDAGGDRGEVTWKELKRYFKRERKEIRRFWKDWANLLWKEAENEGLFSPRFSKRITLGYVLGGILLFGAVVGISQGLFFTGLILIMACLLIVLGSSFLGELSSRGKLQVNWWKKLSKALSGPLNENLKGTHDNVISFALALDINLKKLKKLSISGENWLGVSGDLTAGESLYLLLKSGLDFSNGKRG